ncbi:MULTISPECIES: YncE family protein [unclassified Treponema]|uniref:YncE family protein n=1 Tax=unclassified Treponema TaxID=2638727 RepID=UPI0020A4FB24|nr:MULTISPECIES: YncE family protein [unclassified Treponema]
MKVSIYFLCVIKKNLCIFCFFVSALFGFADFVFDLNLQPYKKAEFFADDHKVEPKLLSSDKTMGRLTFTLKDEASTFVIKKDGFRTHTLNLTESQNKTAFVVLSPINSKYDVVKVFSTGRKPKSVTFVNEKTVAVALLDGTGIDIINIETGETKRISPPKEYAEKFGFVESLVLKHKNELWVSQMPTASIHVFDLTSFEYKITIESSGTWSKVMAYNAGLDRVYLSNWTSQDISVIDPSSYKEEKKIKTKAVPRGMAFSQDGKFIYCAQFEDSAGKSQCRLIKKSLADYKTVYEGGGMGAKRHIVTDYERKLIYVSDMRNNIVEVYSADKDKLLASIKVFFNPNTIQLSADKKLLYVSCRGPNNPDKGYLYKGYVLGRLDIIDTQTFTLIESIEAGNQPTGLDVSPDGKKIVLSDFLDNRIRVYELKS